MLISGLGCYGYSSVSGLMWMQILERSVSGFELLCVTRVICVFQVLICRNYRGDVDMSEIEHFMSLLMDKEEEGTLSPILAHGGVRFMWIKHNNLYRILQTSTNLELKIPIILCTEKLRCFEVTRVIIVNYTKTICN